MAMSDAVITALIMSAASVITQLLINANNRKKREIEDAVKDAQLQAKLAGIESRLDEHNNYGAKLTDINASLYKMTTAIAVIESEIKHLSKGEAV